MEVKAKTTYTKDLLMDFYWFSLKRKAVFWIVFTFYNLFVIGSTLFMFWVGAKLDSTYIMALFIMAFLDTFVFVAYFILPHFQIKKSKNIGTELTYTFYENEFNINSIGDFGSDYSTIKYIALKKAIKTDDKIYLFVNKINAFIVVINELNDDELGFIKEALTNSLGIKKVKWKF